MEVSYLLIDSHCHILSSEYKNPKEIIENSKLCGVDKMIINGFDLESSREAITLANNYDYVYASIGIGPENIDNILALAKKYNLLVIVHCRQAIKDTYELLKKYKINGILHCFSGSAESAKEFIKLGFLIGIGGVVTFKNAKEIKEVVKEIDLSNISLETDSPYLSPEPLRGKVNVPKNIIYVARKIAELKSVSLKEVLEVTSSNVTSKFDL